jgi:1-acyl-sn-glycerol-3-phosphate acyltransferase
MGGALVTRDSGVRRALADLVGALLPLSVRDLEAEAEQRLAKIPNRINEFGYDPYGFSPEWMRRGMLPVLLLYKYYFRCETFDIDRFPAGRVLVVANHAGQLPFDGAMLTAALLMEAQPPRIARQMAEYFVQRLPFMSTLLARGGAMVGTPANCIHMLENDECVMVFPEGVRGMNKTFDKRYRLQRFGLGFMRLALETNTPVVPVGIVGSEEQQPGLLNLERVGRMFGLPALPITAGVLLAGPLGLLPLPVKYRIYFGEPMRFDCDPNDEESVIEAEVGRVKQAISELLERGRCEREAIFS